MEATADTVTAAMDPSPDGLQVSERQFVTFEVAGERFAVPMAPVQEIIRMPEVARLPLAPAALDGLANLRGRVLPIVDLRRVFGSPVRPHDESTRALVIQLDQTLGFVVDRVASVMTIEPGELQPAEALQGVVKAAYLAGVIRRTATASDDRLTMVLDFQRLVADQFTTAARAPRQVEAAGADGRASAGSAEALADERRLVSFAVAGQEYALDIADVQEIVQMPAQVTAVPNTPPHLVGLVSLRQRLLPLVSLRSLFGLPAMPADEHHRVVVVVLPDGHRVGLVTDAVKEVLGVPPAQIEPVPAALARDGDMQEFESICRLDDGRRLVSVIATRQLFRLPGVQDAVDAADAASTREQGLQQESSDMPTTMDRGTTTAAADDMQVVVFRLGAEEFGVPIMSVQEIVRVPEVLTRVPRTPAFVEGVINLRGTVLPVIDQRKRLGLPAIEAHDGQRIMVYTVSGLRTGFIVDAVAEVLRIPGSQITPAPALTDEEEPLITQVAQLDDGRRLVMLITPERLLAARERRAVSAMGRGDAASDQPGRAIDEPTVAGHSTVVDPAYPQAA